jgi:uncharacterized Zn finger protein
MRQKTSMNVDLNSAQDVKCPSCGHLYFKTLYRMKRLSALVSPNGQETFVPVQVLACDSCGEVVQDIE